MTKFFAAANTENGFYSLFDEIFSSETLRRIYILKGGPGSGKSTLMKAIGAEARKRGYCTEYYYCSSDPDSLDGVLLPGQKTAVIDGTAPHLRDPLYPGVVERTVDLSQAFDFTALEKKRETLCQLISAKKQAYRTAYRLLSAAGEVASERDALTQAFFLKEKARSAAFRMTERFRKAEKGRETKRYLSALSVKGAVTLDTFEKKAKKRYAVTGKYGADYAFMGVLYEALKQKGFAMTVCRTPLTDRRIEGIYLDGEDIFFTVCDEQAAQTAYKTVNCMRFIRKDRLQIQRPTLRFLEKSEELLLDGALSALKQAGNFHMQTETIYGKHIDFRRVDREKEKILSEIFDNNM